LGRIARGHQFAGYGNVACLVVANALQQFHELRILHQRRTRRGQPRQDRADGCVDCGDPREVHGALTRGKPQMKAARCCP
jgi:hypothetical protein